MTFLFKKPKAPPPPPAIKPPTPMPDPLADDAARKKKATELAARSGRASTILTDDSDKLGG